MSEQADRAGGPGPGAAAGAAPADADSAGPGQPADTGQGARLGRPRDTGAGAGTGQRADAGEGASPAELAARIAELADQRLRALADLDNLRKRCASQVSRAEAETQAAVAREWLPVIDNLDRALTHAQADPAGVIDGIRAVRDQALSVLARLGYPRRDDRGARFDPARHDAVAARADPGAEDGSVLEVIRPGYGEGARQLRPAQVVVAQAD
jgi:molecular chaperone GrpE